MVADKRLEKRTDESLRDLPTDAKGLSQYVAELEKECAEATDPKRKVSLLGEAAVHLRSLGQLPEARAKLEKALQLIQENHLGLQWEIQQKIRLGHVLQWQKSFDQSNTLFAQVISICRNDSEARVYLDFALQHAGKNRFDQGHYAEALLLFEEAMVLRNQRAAPDDQIESTRVAIETTRKMIR